MTEMNICVIKWDEGKAKESIMAVSEDQLSLACETSKLVQQFLAQQLLILLHGTVSIGEAGPVWNP